MTNTLTKQFIKGLQEYNLTFDDIQNWKYCGGNQKSHYNYFKLCYPNKTIPNTKPIAFVVMR
jgi:hypothetical protein